MTKIYVCVYIYIYTHTYKDSNFRFLTNMELLLPQGRDKTSELRNLKTSPWILVWKAYILRRLWARNKMAQSESGFFWILRLYNDFCGWR